MIFPFRSSTISPMPAAKKKTTRAPTNQLTVAELFAGVGGFRLGLERAGWTVIWSNQWEPATKAQHASDCYVNHFGPEGHVCDDIERVVNGPLAKKIPKHDLLVGGFPCQDYSVARPLPQATGIQGKKGVLWWSINKMLELKKPRFVLLENVDRLLKSPSTQRGRDFAVILSCFHRLGYNVEWRVINAAEYGFPQRRRRVFIFAERSSRKKWRPRERLDETGVFARAFPIIPDPSPEQMKIRETDDVLVDFDISDNPYYESEHFGIGRKVSLFSNAGVMVDGQVHTRKVIPAYDGPLATLGDIVRETGKVPPPFYIDSERVEDWEYQKGAKKERRVEKKSGFEYWYAEGGVAFPDALNKPSRTILTGEGGTAPSRFKHVIKDPRNKKLRRLTPEELEALNGFDRGWTDTGMSDARRAFMMGNALVVGVVFRLAEVIRMDYESWTARTPKASTRKKK